MDAKSRTLDLLRWSTLPALLVILLAGIIVYSNTFQVPFYLDDKPWITQNILIKNLDKYFENTVKYKMVPNRVVAFYTFTLNYHFGELNVTGYHLVNLAIHLLTAILVYLLLRLTFRTPYFQGATRYSGQAAPGAGPALSAFSLQPERLST